MKRLFLIMFFVLFSLRGYAQDVIVTNEGDRIECTVKSEDDTQVKYVAWKDKDNTLRSLPMSSVWSISYDPSLKREVNPTSAATQTFVPKSYSSSIYDTTAPYTAPVKVKKSSNGRGKYIAGGVLSLIGAPVLGFLGIFSGIMLLTEDSPAGYVMLGLGIGAEITLICVGVNQLSKASQAKYACIMDVPVNDKLSLGVYDYAFAPTRQHGTGLGLKIRF